MKSKTTITGATVAVLLAIEPIINSFQHGQLTWLDALKIAVAGATALLGYYAGDSEKKAQ